MGIEGTRQRQPKSAFLVFIGVLGKTRLSPVQKPVKYSCRQETDNLVYRGVRACWIMGQNTHVPLTRLTGLTKRQQSLVRRGAVFLINNL